MSLPVLYHPKIATKSIHWATLVIVCVWLAFVAPSAFAQTPAPEPLSFQVMDKIGALYMSKTFQWSETIRVYAIKLFLMLAAIDFGWLCVNFIFEKKEFEDMMYSVGKKLMTLSFFLFLLMSSNTWIPQVIDSFSKIGKEATKASVATTPDGIVANGFDAAIGVFQILGELDLGEKMAAAMPASLIALFIFLAFLWTAAQLLVAQIESSIAIGAGIILMGFGGSRWTTDMATKYKQYVVATGVKLMLMYIIVGTGATLFNDIKLVSGDGFLASMLVALGSSLMYAFLATKVPAMASGMMSGSPSMGAGDLMTAAIGAGAAIAGMGAAGAALGKAGAGAVGGGAAAATGVGQALGAGLQSGLDMGKSGAGLAAHAMGEVGSHGLGLASGAIGDRMASSSAGFGERVANSAGGKIATSIQASRGGSMAGVGGTESNAPGSAPSPAASNTAPSPAGTSSSSAGSGSGSPAAGANAAQVPAGTGAQAASDSSRSASAGNSAGQRATPAAASPATGPGAGSGSPLDQVPTNSSPGAAVDPSGSATSTPSGDASNGSLSGGSERKSAPQERDRDPLHRRIQDLKGYVPDDAAQAATLQINVNHSQ